MEQRISLVTLAVADLERASAFYAALGWSTRAAPADDVAFFQCGAMIFGLWQRAQMAANAGLELADGPGAIELAYNVGSERAVDEVLAEAREAGASILHEPRATFWGGYSAMFSDPDGHRWEVAHNPHWQLDEAGGVHLPSD